MDKYKHFFHCNLDLVCFANLEGYFEEVNENFIKVLGYDRNDLLDKKFLEFIHPDDIGSTVKEMEKLALGFKTLNFTNRYKTKSNVYKYLEWNSQVDLETKKIHAIARDVTEKIIANQELTFQNEKKEKIAVELLLANQELAFQNREKEKRAAELIIANRELAFQNKEKEKRAAELIVVNQELAFQNEEKEKRAAELIVANQELAFQSKEKEKRAAELIIANRKLKKAEENIRRLNQELEQKVMDRTSELEFVNQELEAFSYSVSHDLRAPIRAINGYTRILEEEYIQKIAPGGIKIFHSIIHNSKKMGVLVDDLLAFSKLGRKQVTISEINMSALVKSVRNDLLSGSEEKRIAFTVNALLPAKGDPSLIKQVWINLLSNAIKYSKLKSNATIEIGSYSKDNLVVYFVKDNGAGFDMQYYDKLFGVFQRLHSQEEFEGTGIGLAIVQRIIHRHKGTVWAESKLNEGACFYFSLPAA